MITILHGENIAASRRELDRTRSDFRGEVVLLEGKNLSETDFIQATQAGSLFGEKKLVIIENLLSGKKKLDLDLASIRAEVVFWEEKALPKTVLDFFKKASVKEFKVATVIFKLVDSLYPNRGKEAVRLFRECLKTEEPEYIFVMIVRQFRLMLNPEGLAPWQEGKINSQAKAFCQARLEEVYKQLLDLDFQNKQGLLAVNLATTLELFFLSL